MSDERIKYIARITPQLSYYGTNTRVLFNESCLKQNKATCNHGKIVKIYIAYEISRNYNISSYPTLENCLFGLGSLTKHVDIGQYKYSGYGIGFDRKGSFSFGNGVGRNVIIFWVDMCSSKKIDNRKTDILILVKGPTQGLEHTQSAEKNVLIWFYWK